MVIFKILTWNNVGNLVINSPKDYKSPQREFFYKSGLIFSKHKMTTFLLSEMQKTEKQEENKSMNKKNVKDD